MFGGNVDVLELCEQRGLASIVRGRLDAIRDVLTADGRTLAQVEENAGALRYGALAAEQLDEIAAILA